MNTARHQLRFTDPAQLTHRWGLARWTPLPLRLITGYGFMEHGYAKIVKNPDVFAGILHTLAALVLGGSGPFAVDGWLARRGRK
jgi:putative oxidoreductase